MTDTFFSAPILNSPYEYPRHFWELDDASTIEEEFMATVKRGVESILAGAVTG